MTQSQTYRSNVADFEPNRWNGPFVFLICCMGLCAVAAIAFWAGMEWNAHLTREAQRIESLKPKRVESRINPPEPLIPCNDPIKSRELVSQICRARRRAI